MKYERSNAFVAENGSSVYAHARARVGICGISYQHVYSVYMFEPLVNMPTCRRSYEYLYLRMHIYAHRCSCMGHGHKCINKRMHEYM